MTLDEAKKILQKELQPDGGLYDPGRYLHYTPQRDIACLDGDFTADDLEAIAVYMRSTSDGSGGT